MRLLGLAAACALLLAPAGRDVNVSQAPGLQNEPSVAIDPANPQVLLAGSNSFSEGAMRVYSSTDGGATWASSTLTPPTDPKRSCSADPAVGIDRNSRQYFAFLRTAPCAERRSRVHVASRSGPDARWNVPANPVARLGRALADDKPTLTVDTSPTSPYEGRVYVAWSRVLRPSLIVLLISHSDDGGRTWSKPRRVNDSGEFASYASVAVAPSGAVYVAWDEISAATIRIDRAADGERFGRDRLVAQYRRFLIPHCGGSGVVIPAQGTHCIRSNPIVTVDGSKGPYRGRVFVTYSAYEPHGTQDVFLTAFNRSLRALYGYPLRQVHSRVTQADGEALVDQFWPASAVDSSTGRLWVCFYDTAGDPDRKKTVFSCTASSDGGKTFASPLSVAGAPSDATEPGTDARAYGDYQGLAVGNGVAHPMWTDTRDLAVLGEEIYTTTLTDADVSQ